MVGNAPRRYNKQSGHVCNQAYVPASFSEKDKVYVLRRRVNLSSESSQQFQTRQSTIFYHELNEFHELTRIYE